MKTWVSAAAIVAFGAVLWSGTALGQGTPKTGCEAVKAGAPQRVEGQVVRIDQKQSKVILRSADGKTHEFQASQETLKELKVGDQLEAQLRDAANC